MRSYRLGATKAKKGGQRYEDVLHCLLQGMSGAIILVNSKGNILYCRGEIQKITGYEMQEIVGKNLFSFWLEKEVHQKREQNHWFRYLTRQKNITFIPFRNKLANLDYIDMEVHQPCLHESKNTLVLVLKKSTETAEEEIKLLKAITEAREHEKELLASELHDNINQLIIATKLLVEAARVNPNKEELLQLSSTNLQLASEAIRNLSYSKTSFYLQEQGLAFAVEGFLSMLRSASMVSFHTEWEENLVKTLPYEASLQLYRIIQEATTNILRHSKATRAEITFQKIGNRACLLIQDNGQGCTLPAVKAGIGLSGIAKRVRLLNGQLRLSTHQGIGMVLEIEFPV
jgi:PAS domain S-box-containing protein